ncbi:MAG: PQQ-like beta-propeller repeat protein [Planctomycetia bacterium]|nr:PQQ-like beta-propeller repeat protein [Planctomycetia bacterium]
MSKCKRRREFATVRTWNVQAALSAVCLLCLQVFAPTAGSAPARPAIRVGDWPQWRGPSRDGVATETGLANDWSARPPRLAWKASGLGEGYSSISIADGRIYTMGDRGSEQFVIALGLKDGAALWATPIGKSWQGGGYAGPRCTPTIDGRRLYAIGTGGELVCLDAATGNVHWRKNFARDFGGKMMSHWGYSESPLVDGDRLVCTPGGPNAALVALDKTTGRTIWTASVPDLGGSGKDGAAYSSIVVSEGAGVRQYVQLMGKGLVGIRADDGRYLWGYNRVANRTANIPTPIVRGDYVFGSTGYQTGAALLKLKRTADGVDAEEVYFLDARTLQNHHGGLVLVGDYLYGGNGHRAGSPVCVEFLTGRIGWNGGRGPGSGSAAVVFADGELYFRYENGTMALIDASPDGYKLKGTFEIPGVEKPSWPHPVVAGGKLYLREQDALLCYDVKR